MPEPRKANKLFLRQENRKRDHYMQLFLRTVLALLSMSTAQVNSTRRNTQAFPIGGICEILPHQFASSRKLDSPSCSNSSPPRDTQTLPKWRPLSLPRNPGHQHQQHQERPRGCRGLTNGAQGKDTELPPPPLPFPDQGRAQGVSKPAWVLPSTASR